MFTTVWQVSHNIDPGLCCPTVRFPLMSSVSPPQSLSIIPARTEELGRNEKSVRRDFIFYFVSLPSRCQRKKHFPATSKWLKVKTSHLQEADGAFSGAEYNLGQYKTIYVDN